VLLSEATVRDFVRQVRAELAGGGVAGGDGPSGAYICRGRSPTSAADLNRENRSQD
jgi:hypothetical protein